MMCKSFARPLLDYSKIIYDHAYSASFHQNIEKMQYNEALAMTVTSKEKLYQKLDLELFQ